MDCIGQGKCKILSVADLQDVYHALRLVPDLQKDCRITPCDRWHTYFYLRLGMDLNVSPAI